MAINLDPNRGIYRRIHRHARNHVAQRLARFLATDLDFPERGVQPVDRLPVVLDRARMQRHNLRRLLGRGELGLEPVAIGAQLRQPGRRLGLTDNPLHRIADRALELMLDTGELCLELRPRIDSAGSQALALGIVDLHIVSERFLVAHPLLEPGDGELLDLVETIGPAITAGAGVLCGRADDTQPAEIAVLDRHAAAAHAASEEARQKMHCTRSRARGGEAHLLAARGRGREGLFIDDAQLRRVLPNPFALRIDAAHALAGVGVLYHARAIPDELAAIGHILDDAVAALPRAHDGRRHPEAAERRRDLLSIELGDDRAHRSAFGIACKYAAYHFRLMLDNLALARPAGDRVIPIGEAAGGTAVTNDAGLAAAHLVRQVLEIERADQATDADLDLIGLAIMDGADRDALEGQPLVEAGQVLLVARQSIEGLDHDDVDRARDRRLHHGHQPVAAEDRCSGARAIGEAGDDGQAFLVAIRFTKGELIFDRAIALQVG